MQPSSSFPFFNTLGMNTVENVTGFSDIRV
jgi:hypothetical protein